MEHSLLYRDVRYVIGPEQDGSRRWTIHPEGRGVSGIAEASRAHGSFKVAVLAARQAIDAWLAAAAGHPSAAP